MGFMAGFGPAFSNSYDAALNRSAQREDDMVRYQFEALMKKQDEWNKYTAEDRKAVQAAEQYVKDYNQPPEAIGVVYNWLKTDRSSDWIENALQNGSFEISAATGEVKKAPDIEKAGQQVDKAQTDQQMIQSGLAPAAPAAPAQSAQPAAQPKFDGGGFLSQLYPGMKRKSRQDKVTDRVAEASGMTPDQVNQRLNTQYQSPTFDTSGVQFKQGASQSMEGLSAAEVQYKYNQALKSGDKANIELYGGMKEAYDEIANRDAMLKNPQGIQVIQYKDPQTGEIRTRAAQQTAKGWNVGDGIIPVDQVRILSEDEKKSRAELAKGTEEGRKLQASQAKAMNMFASGSQLIKMAQANPVVLTRVGNIAAGVVGLSNEAKAAINLLNGGQAKGSSQYDDAIATLSRQEQQIDEQLASVKDQATAINLFQSKLTLMAYRAGDLEGQRGQSLNEKDFSRMYEILSNSGGDPKVFEQNMTEYMNGLRSNLNEQASQFNDYNGQLQEYEATYGRGSAPKSSSIRNMDDLIKSSNNPSVREAYDIMTRKSTVPNAPEITNPNEKQKVSTEAKIKKKAKPLGEAVKFLKANPQYAKQFDEVYGDIVKAEDILGTLETPPQTQGQ